MPKVFGKKQVATPAVKSHWPVGWGSLFETLRVIPWLPLTALGTLAGVLLLSLYFRSIDYFPSDLSALVGLGVATAVCALGLYVALAFGLLAPAVKYRQYRNADKTTLDAWERAFSTLELAALQLGCVSLLFGWLANKKYHDCSQIFSSYTAIAVVAGLCCLIALVRIGWANGTVEQRLRRLSTGFEIVLYSAPAVAIFAYLLPIFKTTYFDFSNVFFVLWALAILVNALLPERLPAVALLAVGALVVWIAFIAFPVMVGKGSLFSQMVASVMGVRQNHVQEFRVPSKTCLLIQSGLGTSSTPAVHCGSGDWSAVNMQVLSNVGDQWFVEIQTDTKQDSAGTLLRMSIPKADIHLVQGPESRESKQVVMACEK